MLVDTSVWVAHLRQGGTGLEDLLLDGQVLCHDFVIGELACGGLKNRQEVLSLLESLNQARLAQHEEALKLIEQRRLMGKGLGYVDMHLLASTLLSGVSLWTLGKKLDEAASALGIRFSPSG